MSAPLLQTQDLVKRYPLGGFFDRGRRVVHALEGVSLEIRAGETVALVGESGCGKSTLGRCIVRLVEPSGGTVRLRGEDVATLLRDDPMRLRRAVQIVFQDPYASLNPRRTIGQSLDDPLRVHRMGDAAARRERAAALLQQVGLSPEYLARYPHELSGGQRQRVAIARALAPGPDLIVCDEAVSALDVSIQAQIVNLLKDIQAATGVAYLFITHNLELVRRIADRIVVMYLGEVVESGDAGTMRASLVHPYSRALFAAAPRVRRGAGERGKVAAAGLISGEVPSAIDPPSGCRFHPRCPRKQDVCASSPPPLAQAGGREVRCHFAVEFAKETT